MLICKLAKLLSLKSAVLQGLCALQWLGFVRKLKKVLALCVVMLLYYAPFSRHCGGKRRKS